MPDFTQYLPPGVYVEEEQTPLVSITGAAPAVVGIVGPAIGYRQHTEAITASATPVTLAKTGVDLTTGFEVRGEDGTVYAETTDYTLATQSVGATGTADDTATLTRVADGGITEGATVYLTYRYTDLDYAQPFSAFDFDTVKEVYGEPINIATGAVISPVSLAAKVAFENGAAQVVIVATPTPTAVTREELQAGLSRLAAVPDVTLVVPLPVGLTGTEVAPGDLIDVATDLESSVVTSSETDKQYRIGLLGYEATATVDPLTAAAAISSRRVGIVTPNQLLFYNGFANQILTVAGYYLAAGIAGRFAGQEVQEPVTRRQIRGFSGLPPAVLAEQTVARKNALSAGGVMVVEYDRNQRLRVRHGVSTDPTSVLTREISITRARDAMMQSLSDSIDAAGLIGSTVDEETPVRVKGVISGVLESLVDAGTIVNYHSLGVRQQSVDPTVIEVKFQYQPAYPLNYITVAFSVSSLTGEIVEDLAAAA